MSLAVIVALVHEIVLTAVVPVTAVARVNEFMSERVGGRAPHAALMCADGREVTWRAERPPNRSTGSSCHPERMSASWRVAVLANE